MKSLVPLAGVLLLSTAVPAVAQDRKTKDPLTGRSRDEIVKALAKINAPLDRKLDATAKERQLALQRLRSYRYLAGVAHDVDLDAELTRQAAAAAKICEKLGELSHNPTNPGLDDDEYKLAKKGARSSNLAAGFPTLTAAVDAWMDDSDRGNVDQVGHRRWCLNPSLKKAGFSRSGDYSAMVYDSGRKNPPDYDYVSWPPRGLMPVEYLKAEHAWNVSLNPKKYKAMTDKVKVAVYLLGEDGKKAGDALEIDDQNVNTEGYGIPNCLVFRPAKVEVTAGKKYRVEIRGLQTASGKAATLSYAVEFCRMAKE